MKSLKLPFIAGLENMAYEELLEAMETSASRACIDQINWPDRFPYGPLAAFDIARSDKYIFISYFVKGLDLRALFGNDHDPVWQDSCVEFFIKDPASPCYYNFEFNCIGTCLASKKTGRNEGETLAAGDMARIIRHTSLPREPFEEKGGIFAWQLVAGIPFDVLGIDPANLPATLRANFYKCGDGTSHPHYVSWNPIESPDPNFHLPEFFGELVVE